MAGAMEVDQKGQVQDILDEITNVVPDETPIFSLMPKGKVLANKKTTTQVQTIDDEDLDGVADGTDVTVFDTQAREEIEMYAQHFRQPWQVSNWSENSQIAGGTTEVANQKAICIVKLKRRIEGRFGSNLECAKQPTAAKNVCRGIAKWLDNSAQATLPVPDGFRPASACTYSSTLAAFTEAEFEAMGAAAFIDNGNVAVDWDGFLAMALQQKFDNMTARDPAATSSNYPVRTWNQDAAKKAFVKVVESLTFSWGTCRLHPHGRLYKDLAGADTAYTSRSGLFLTMKRWQVRFLNGIKPNLVTLPNLGGGPRGYAEAYCMALCLNPLGQAKAEIAS